MVLVQDYSTSVVRWDMVRTTPPCLVRCGGATWSSGVRRARNVWTVGQKAASRKIPLLPEKCPYRGTRRLSCVDCDGVEVALLGRHSYIAL